MTALALPTKGVLAFVSFIKARERHRRVKEEPGITWATLKAKPDPIINKYRFCNVRRNDDRVTKFIHKWFFEVKGWREEPELWFAFAVARLFNNEDTIADIDEYILPYNPLKMAKTLKRRAALGEKNFNAAYIVSTNGRAMSKVDYVIDHVLTPLWKHRTHLSDFISRQECLGPVHQLLCDQNGFKSFMAAQIVADLKYANPDRWADFHTFVASGPGSKRGLNRLLGRDKDAPMPEAMFRATLLLLRDSANARLTGWEPVTAQDIQNCLCEFDKYQRGVLGEEQGPKQLYKPRGEVN